MADASEILKPRETKWYGWRASHPDHRDLKFADHHPLRFDLPSQADLTKEMPPVYDQGDLGSCTANATAGAVQHLRKKLGRPDNFVPSRLFIYYNSRLLEGTVGIDAGAEMRSAIKVVNTVGAPKESLWWYDVKKFKVKPNKGVYDNGGTHKSTQYLALNQDLTELRTCLANGFPFVFGFEVFEAFEGDEVTKTGNVSMPRTRDQPIGGHAVLCVGYDDTSRKFLIRNSWGADWGLNGYFHLPYEYVLSNDLALDFWTLRASE